MINESILVHNYSRRALVDAKPPCLCHTVSSMGFGKRVTSCTVSANNFTALKTPCSTYTSPLPDLWPPRSLLLSLQFCFFQDVIYPESHSLWSFQIGFFHLAVCIDASSKAFPGLVAPLLLLSFLPSFFLALWRDTYHVVDTRHCVALRRTMCCSDIFMNYKMVTTLILATTSDPSHSYHSCVCVCVCVCVCDETIEDILS